MIFLDHAAGAFPKAPGVAEAMAEYIRSGSPNVARGGYGMAYDAADRIMDVRERLAGFFGVSDPRRVIFTPGCTWGLNMILRGIDWERRGFSLMGHPHNAAVRTLHALKAQTGSSVMIVTHGSNVSGELTCLPSPDDHSLVVVDAAQTAGIIPVDFDGCGADAMAFSGHKGMMGPQGIGVLLLSERMTQVLAPSVTGGTGTRSDLPEMPLSLPERFEPGTPNLPGIIGLGAAADYVCAHFSDIQITARRQASLMRALFSGIPGVSMIGAVDLPIVSLDFHGLDNAEAAYRLETEHGCGLHCNPAAHRALGTYPHGTVRLSAGYHTRDEELTQAAEAVRRIVK